MKNQYFGDVNDYRKYGLLHALQSRGDGKLLLAWMLTPDDRGQDGGYRSYLEEPTKWRHFDPELYDGLSALLQSAPTPQVSLIEGAGLLPRTMYYSEVVPDGSKDRDAWRKGLLRAASGVDLVFFDPDNGIEVRSKPVGRKESSKYVMWREIEGVWHAGCSLLIYQHFPREPREAFAERMAAELQRRTSAAFMRAFYTAHVLFLLAVQAQHAAPFRMAVSSFLPRWERQIEVIQLAN